MTRKKIGLALGGGAARGLAHIGVLEVLEREGVPIDMIAGTSIGALVGGFYAGTRDLPAMKRLAQEVGRKRLYYFTDFGIPRTGLIRWTRVENRLKKVIGGATFADLKIPLACVAMDFDNAEEIVLDSGPVWEAMRASATIPAVLALTTVRGRRLIDGGISNPVPVSTLRKMGADFIIAVNVLPKRTPVDSREANIFTIMVKTVYLLSYRVMESSLSGADVVIQPQTDEIGFADFHRSEECIRLGRVAAEAALPEIRRRLG